VSRGEEIILKGFFELSSCRSFGMGPGPIPWDAIMDYADRQGFEPDVRSLFCDMIRQLDSFWLEQEQAAWERKTQGGKG
jgi:hypothetical protein